MFELLPDAAPQRLNVVIDGRAVAVPAGFTAAAARLLHGGGATRHTALSGEARAPYCMMGVCFECLMVIDGVASRQACMVRVRPGMRIERQLGTRELK